MWQGCSLSMASKERGRLPTTQFLLPFGMINGLRLRAGGGLAPFDGVTVWQAKCPPQLCPCPWTLLHLPGVKGTSVPVWAPFAVVGGHPGPSRLGWDDC